MHPSRQTQGALAAWLAIQVPFMPKDACWLNLIEPGWQQLRSLALKGKRFATLDELSAALEAALDSWNAHRHWKQRPQVQVVIRGSFSVVPNNPKTSRENY